MFSRFFIDRPIFAAVLSIVITLAGGLALLNLPVAQYPEITPAGRHVSHQPTPGPAPRWSPTPSPPRSSSRSTASPGMLYMSSQSGNDGSYTLTVTFEIGTDLNTALVMVQNRVHAGPAAAADGGAAPGDHHPQADPGHPARSSASPRRTAGTTTST